MSKGMVWPPSTGVRLPCSVILVGRRMMRQSAMLCMTRRVHELPVIAEVVRLVVMLRRQHERDAVRGEVVHVPPDHARDVQAVIRARQGDALRVRPIGEN